jgi:3-oxoacyl-[acyl-carrier-protein] synthase-3
MVKGAVRAAITGTGMYAPQQVVENDFFSRKYGREMDVFLREQRNITKRRFMAAEQATSDLILPAATQAMGCAGVQPGEIDLVIVATDTPDYISPATAAVVQYKLGLSRAGSFDLNSACAGFATALDVASKYILSDSRYRHVLVIGAYGMSKHFDWSDYKVTSVFADGAGAVVLSRTECTGLDDTGTFAGIENGIGILATQLYSDGQYHDHMGIYAGGTRTPLSQEVLGDGGHLLKFAKRIPPETNAVHWPRLMNAILDRIQARADQVDHYFFTQINYQSIVETMRKLNVPLSRAHNIMDRFGYTGSACLPMALADAAQKNKLKRNDLVMMIGSGGGMSMAGVALRWGYDT